MELMNKMEPPVATSFLCFFSIRAGTQMILVYSLAQALFSLCMSAGSIVFTASTWGYGTSGTTQLFSCAWNLAGVPIILMGIWALQAKNGAVLRIFLYYLTATFFVDAFFVLDIFLVKDTCAQLGNQVDINAIGGPLSQQVQSEVSPQDRAFACGIARGTSALLCCSMLLFMAYLVYIVWSHVRELTDAGSAGVLHRLMNWEERDNREWSKFEHGMKIRYGSFAPPGHHFHDAPYGSYADVPYSTL
jgi:hypothetical protein